VQRGQDRGKQAHAKASPCRSTSFQPWQQRIPDAPPGFYLMTRKFGACPGVEPSKVHAPTPLRHCSLPPRANGAIYGRYRPCWARDVCQRPKSCTPTCLAGPAYPRVLGKITRSPRRGERSSGGRHPLTPITCESALVDYPCVKSQPAPSQTRRQRVIVKRVERDLSRVQVTASGSCGRTVNWAAYR